MLLPPAVNLAAVVLILLGSTLTILSVSSAGRVRAAALDAAVSNTSKVLASVQTTYGTGSRFSRGIDTAIGDPSDAGLSIRVLADLLSRHPEAMIRGRVGSDFQ